nr:MAG TPA: hypothetical protein [Caudoviricetes sp.]
MPHKSSQRLNITILIYIIVAKISNLSNYKS